MKIKPDLSTGNDKLKYLFLVIPSFYFLIAVYFRSILGATSLRSVDPEYIYFMSGLGIAEGHLKIGHIDNPGTPLQYLVALVFRITHLFRGGDTSFINDLFLHPDLYLAIVNLSITGIVVFAIFAAGKMVYRKTGSILYGLLIQTMPFLPVIWYDLIGRVTPELLFPIPLFAISILLINYLFTEKHTLKIRDIALIGFVFAFGLSIKLTFISLWLIPVIVIVDWKKKLQFLGFGILFFLLIAIPVTLQLETFWNWIKALFLHSGTYGGGKEDIINFSAFKTNLNDLIGLEQTFGWLFIGLLALLMISVLFYRDKLKNWKGTWISIAVLAAISVQYILTGKHYAHRYFIPALMLTPLLIILSIELIKSLYPRRSIALLFNILLILFMGWNINRQFKYIRIKSDVIGSQVESRKATWHVVSSLEENSVKIIVSQDYGSPFKEYALLYSTAWAANSLRPHYYQELLMLYPNTYQYTTWDDKFQHWGDHFNPSEVLTKGMPVYIYLENNSNELYNRTIDKIDPRKEFAFLPDTIFINQKNNEILFKLNLVENIAESSE